MAQRDPEWLCINLGVVICIECSGIHRGLGTHISKVRSLLLDDVPLSTLRTLWLLGNERVNGVLEHSIPADYAKISAQSTLNEKERFILGKYAFKMFIDPMRSAAANASHQEVDGMLMRSAMDNEVMAVFEAICYGANIDAKVSTAEYIHFVALSMAQRVRERVYIDSVRCDALCFFDVLSVRREREQDGIA